uniref:Uncharacterized protein n=1 Tax=Arundo donax TaxID=35708 RepID=A0A0A8ZVQ5_ARUDO
MTLGSVLDFHPWSAMTRCKDTSKEISSVDSVLTAIYI